jgi:tetratricopeptide (TPR) repeat protein
MTYPGNATLTREMQDRIVSTFRQTLSAAAAGNRQEAKLGCDFILRLDSLFTPARDLLERIGVGEGPVSTEDLAATIGDAAAEPTSGAAEEASAETSPAFADPAAAAAVAAAAQPPDIDDLSDLDLEIGLSDPQPAQPETVAEPVPVVDAPPPVEPTPEAEPAPPPVEPTPEAEPAPPPQVNEPSADPSPPPPQAPATAPSEPVITAPSPPVDAPPPVDKLDDLDLDVGEGLDTPAAEPSPMVEPPPPVEPTPEAEPVPAAESVPPADQLLPPDVPATEPAAVEATPEPEPPEAPTDTPEAAEPPSVAAETEAAAVADETPSASELDELDDLDLSVADQEPAEPAPPAPESAAIPLSTEPAAQLDTESQQRIDDLLAEGQQAFDGGEYQGAIDAWSRIFLIDIDHAEANKRIEEARKLKAEADRKVEEKFHEGLANLESGENDAAADSFRAVLEMQPSHLQARDYLEKLEAGEVPVPVEIPKPAEADSFDGDPAAVDLEASGELDEKPTAKPDRGTKAVGDRMVSVKKSPFKSKSFLAIAAVGLIAALGGSWYLFKNRDKYFPNAAQEAPTTTAPDPVARANGLHEQGRTSIAIAQLRRLPPDHPQYDEAQALIASWELELAPVDVGPGGPSPQELARRESLVAEAPPSCSQRQQRWRRSRAPRSSSWPEPMNSCRICRTSSPSSAKANGTWRCAISGCCTRPTPATVT